METFIGNIMISQQCFLAFTDIKNKIIKYVRSYFSYLYVAF